MKAKIQGQRFPFARGREVCPRADYPNNSHGGDLGEGRFYDPIITYLGS